MQNFLLRRSIVMRLTFAATVLTAMTLGISSKADAQDFHLVEPSGVITADVYLQSGRLIVNDADSNRYVFFRDRSFDSINGQYIGYWLPGPRRVLRFPRSGAGLMQIADLDHVFPRYVFSRRSVRRLRGRPRPGFGRAQCFIPPYFISPYSYLNQGFPGYGFPGFGFPGYGVPVFGYQSFGIGMGVGPITNSYSFRRGLYGPRYRSMQSIVLDARIVPRSPLPPVDLDLVNTAPREIRVTVIDRGTPQSTKQVRIPPQGESTITVQRDAGADSVRTVQTFAPDGTAITREISTPIEPTSRYELVVHEWRLQSVAIDRTGKSPNPIEDVQYQGRGLGRFNLPPGDQLKPGQLDVVRMAIQAGNQGTVNPILDDSKPTSPTRPLSPLEKMLQQQRQMQQR